MGGGVEAARRGAVSSTSALPLLPGPVGGEGRGGEGRGERREGQAMWTQSDTTAQPGVALWRRALCLTRAQPRQLLQETTGGLQ